MTTDYREALHRVLPAAFIASLDPIYVNSLTELLRQKDDTVDLLQRTLEGQERKIERLTLMLQRSHAALKDLCRSQEALDALPDELRERVYSVGDDLLIQEYADELSSSGSEMAPTMFEMADPPFSLLTLRPKLALAAAQEVQREGGEYVGIACEAQGFCIKATLRVKAKPGWQLDRPRMQSALRRHIPNNIQLNVKLEVEVPL